ncbi:MAG: hypothetical protein KAJ10_05395, partial [Thermodesulfovibrionia bacterium]|nr:hypothetical protein [Thermodesulfovibrionia bacterium]
MAFWDKTIAKLFPKTLNKQISQEANQIAQQGIEKIKCQLGYGGYGGISSHYAHGGGAKWRGGLSASGQPLFLDHNTLRLNARKAYHETPQAKALVDRYADTVADTGLILEPTPKYEILGLSMEQA